LYNIVVKLHNIAVRSDIMTAKKTKKNESVLTPEDVMKFEIANELGLGEKISEVGWGGLTAEETGRIGGIITRRKRSSMSKGAASQG